MLRRISWTIAWFLIGLATFGKGGFYGSSEFLVPVLFGLSAGFGFLFALAMEKYEKHRGKIIYISFALWTLCFMFDANSVFGTPSSVIVLFSAPISIFTRYIWLRPTEVQLFLMWLMSFCIGYLQWCVFIPWLNRWAARLQKRSKGEVD